MLRIVSSKGEFELSPNQVIDWEELFHVLGENADLKSWSFLLPKSPANQNIVRDFIFVDTPRVQDVSIAVQVEVFGQIWSEGPLIFIDDTPDHWEVSFAGQLGFFLEKIEGKKLSDFNYPDPTIVDIYSHAETVIGDSDSYDYVFAPVDVPSLNGQIWHPAQVNSVVVDSNGDFDRFAEFYRTFEVEEYNPKRIAVSGTSVAYETGATVKFAGKYYTAVSNANVDESPDTTPAKWTQETLGNKKWYVPIVPFLFVFKVLQRIFDQIDVRLSGQIFENSEIQNLLFFNLKALNSLDDQGEIDTVLTNTSIVYANHLPDILVRDLLKEIGIFFNQRFDYKANESSLVFSHRTRILQSEVLTGLKDSLIRFETIHREKRTYNLSYSYNIKDVELASDTWVGTLEGINSEIGSSDIQSIFATLPMRYGFQEVDPSWQEYSGDSRMDLNYPGLWWRPVSSSSINSDVPNTFLLWRGLHVYTTGSWVNFPSLPQVSSDLNFNNTSGYTHTLLWKGTGGLHEKWWSEYLYTLSLAKVLRLYLLFDPSSWDRSRILNRQAIGEMILLLERAKISVRNTGNRLIAEVEAIKL